MSTSYYAHLVCGFQAELREVMKKVTKYNENTGEPYSVNVPSHRELVVAGKVVADDEDEHSDFYLGEDYEGLKLGSSLDGYHFGQKWLGEVLAEVNPDGKDIATFPALGVPEKVQKFADKHSLTPTWIISFSYS